MMVRAPGAEARRGPATPPAAPPAAGSPWRPRLPAGARYAMAALAPLAALAVTLAGEPQLFFPVLAAVVLAAWYGGLGPGIAATLLSAGLLDYVFLVPRYAFTARGAGDLFKLTLFSALGVTVSVLCERLLRARATAEARADESARLAAVLREQTVELEQQAEEAQALSEELEETNEQLRLVMDESATAQERLGLVLETMAEGVVLFDGEGRIRYLNATAARTLGRPPQELLGAAWDDPRIRLARPGGAPLVPDDFPVERVRRTGVTLHGEEIEVPRADGGRRVLRVNGAPLRGDGGVVEGVVVSFDDVTADREAEEALRESEARFRTMADSAPVLMWLAGTDAGCYFFNRAWLEFTGRTLEQERGHGWAEGVHPDDYARALTLYLSSFEARRAFVMEYRLRRHDGEYRWLLDNGVPLFTPDGTFSGYIGSCVDITERREAEEQQRFLAEAGSTLASSLDYEETLRRVCRLAVPALGDYCVIDLVADDGTFRRVAASHADPAAAPLMEQVRRYPPRPDSRHPVAQVVRTGESYVDNHVTPAFVDATAVDAGHGQVLRRLGVRALLAVPLVARGRILGGVMLCTSDDGRRYDAAEVVRAEELARRAAFAIDNARLYERAVEASRAKSDFLAVMSHELRTPLNAILGYTDLFLADLPAPLPPPVRPKMERVKGAARHLLELIDEVLTFARLEAGQEEVRAAPVAAAALAQEAAALVEPLALERGIAFRVEGPSPDFPLVTDARKVRQVLVNLLGNAVKFTDAGEAVLAVRREGAEAVFEVRDTGVGIAPEHLERIFEPFWQADQGLMRAHGGSGLGLGVARELARLLGGDVTVRSTLGAGSVFTLRLPVGSLESASAES
jgi:PAS domain S-box-containing protein